MQCLYSLMANAKTLLNLFDMLKLAEKQLSVLFALIAGAERQSHTV